MMKLPVAVLAALAMTLTLTVAAPAAAQSTPTLTVTPASVERPASGDKPVTLYFSHTGCSGCWVELDPGWDSPDTNQAVKGKNADFGAANRWATDKTIGGKRGKGAVPGAFGIKVRPGDLLPSFIRFTLNDASGVRAEAKVWLNTPGLVVENHEPQQPQLQQQEPEYSLQEVSTLCAHQLRDLTSAVQKVSAVWSPACRGQEAYDANHSSRYFFVTTTSSGTLSLVVESCTAVRLSVRGGTETSGLIFSNAFSGYDVWSGSGSTRVAWPPFRQPKGVAAIRHQQDAVGRRPALTPNQAYTIEVAARYAGQLGEFTLSYSTSDTGFTATSGRCSTTGDSGTLKPARTRWSCTQEFHECLAEADPQFWSNAHLYGGQRTIRSGDFSRFPDPTHH